MGNNSIPTHKFSDADELALPFRLVELTRPTEYLVSEPHRHNYFEIFYFTEGSGSHLVDFEEYSIKSPSLHFVAPGQVHRVERSADSSGKVILFTREFFELHSEINDILYRLPFLKEEKGPAYSLQGSIKDEVERVVADIESEFAKGEDSSLQVLQSYIYILLLRCRDYYEEQNKVVITQEDSLMARFRQMVEAKFVDWHKPSAYSEELSVSSDVLNETVKSFVNKSAGNYIHDRIILEAKRLLYNTELSAKEIAYKLSYEDPAYFSRFFKQKTGQSISEYRDSSREKYNH